MASSAVVGISISERMCLYSSSCFSETAVTRKPLFGTASTRPSFARSSMASRTGVADTPKRTARVGAEYTSPARSSPAISAARSASATRSR